MWINNQQEAFGRNISPSTVALAVSGLKLETSSAALRSSPAALHGFSNSCVLVRQNFNK